MKAILLLFILSMFTSFSVLAQEFSKVDDVVKTYPRTFKNPDNLAVLINKDFSLPEDKVRAIYTWIALNIEYDVESKISVDVEVHSFKTKKEKLQLEQNILEDLALKTLHDKKALCEGYSALFKILCDLSSIKSQFIRGTAKSNMSEIGKSITGTNHTWNAVKIKRKWQLIDVTWGAGYVNNGNFVWDFTDSYFLTDPEIFFLKHYPKDKKWLLIKKSEKKFVGLPYYYRDFFDSKIEFIKPKKGIIKINENKPLRVVIRNSQNEKVHFKFSDEEISVKIDPIIEKDQCNYEVKPGAGKYLTIYINRNPYISYKIKKPLKL